MTDQQKQRREQILWTLIYSHALKLADVDDVDGGELDAHTVRAMQVSPKVAAEYITSYSGLEVKPEDITAWTTGWLSDNGFNPEVTVDERRRCPTCNGEYAVCSDCGKGL